MRIPSGTTDRYIYFVAVDETDLSSRETGLSSFTVYRSRNGAAPAAFTTPTINETDASNMPGVYELLLDEDTTIAAGNDAEELVLHISHAGMAPVTRVVELYRPETTEGRTLSLESDGHGHADVKEWLGSAPAALVDTNKVPASLQHSGTGVITSTTYAAGAITNTVLAANAISASTIATGSFTSSKFAASAITSTTLASNAIGSTQIATGAITNLKFAAGAITSTVIAADAIGASQIAANAITSGKIAADAIGATQIAAGALTSAKFAAGAITAAVIATDAVDADALSADAVAEIDAAVATALTDLHLDKLFAADYDPASPPGVATALLNELIQDDGGVSQFTANALEQASAAMASTISPILVNSGRTWRVKETSAGYISDKIITLPPAFSGALAFDFSDVRNPRTTINTVDSVADVTDPPNSPALTIANESIDAERRQVHFDVSTLTDDMDYRITCVVTTVDDQTISVTAVLRCRST